MPYTKAYRRYRTRARKTRLMGGIRKTFTGARFQPRTPMTAGKVKRIIDAELKVKDNAVEDVPIPTVLGSINRLSQVDQGDNNDQRTGNWIKPVALMGQITVVGNNAAPPGDVPLFRIGIACWKENETLNAFSINQIAQDTTDPHQGYSVENKGQFKILWSRTGILSNHNQNPQYQKTFRFYVKPSAKVLFDDAAAKNNQLFFFGWSDVDTLADPPVVTYSTRLRYTDS